MANIMDYLDWRGDLTMEADGFNEVDNLILAQLVYVDFEGIVPPPKQGDIYLKEASDLFWQRHTKKEILSHVSMTKSAPFLMRKLAESRRFRGAKLSAYINDISDEEQSQFSVVCVRLADGSLYVAFSGTDNTIVGWRENFNMGFLSETPGQKKAVKYLNWAAANEEGTLRVGGHSKGGNLAVYAAVKCDAAIKEKIVHVYSNDGPGFSRDVVESDEYQQMLPKISTILPESSIVGMLLEHQEKYEVVKSTERGVGQHDAMSWEVLGPSFCYVEHLAAESLLLDETMKNFIEQLDNEERRQLINAVFTLLEEAEIRTVDDFYNSKWKKIQELVKAQSKLPEETQKIFSKALRSLWNSGNDTIRRSVKQAMREHRGEAQEPLLGKKE